MLHLTRRIALCVDVAHFFELQRPFHRYRILEAPAKEQEVFVSEKLLSQPFAIRAPLPQLTHQER